MHPLAKTISRPESAKTSRMKLDHSLCGSQEKEESRTADPPSACPQRVCLVVVTRRAHSSRRRHAQQQGCWLIWLVLAAALEKAASGKAERLWHARCQSVRKCGGADRQRQQWQQQLQQRRQQQGQCRPAFAPGGQRAPCVKGLGFRRRASVPTTGREHTHQFCTVQCLHTQVENN